MNRKSNIILSILALLIISCSEKEEMSVCASKVRKDFVHKNLTVNVSDGCVVKYAIPNEFKVTGNATIVVKEDSIQKNNNLTIRLSIGKLITSNSTCILESDEKTMQIRLVSGTAHIETKDRKLPLETGKILKIGS